MIEHSRRTSWLAALALLTMAACWGSTFFLIKDLLDRVPTLDFLAVRFAIASAVLVLVAPKALGRLSPEVRNHAAVLGLLYGVAQILQTTGLVVCTAATVHDGIVLPDRTGDWVSVIYMAVVAGGLALLAQTWAQAHLPPTRSALIMSMEPVFASFFAVWLGGEHLTSRLLLGGSMVLAAMLVVELAPRRVVEGEVPHIAV